VAVSKNSEGESQMRLGFEDLEFVMCISPLVKCLSGANLEMAEPYRNTQRGKKRSESKLLKGGCLEVSIHSQNQSISETDLRHGYGSHVRAGEIRKSGIKLKDSWSGSTGHSGFPSRALVKSIQRLNTSSDPTYNVGVELEIREHLGDFVAAGRLVSAAIGRSSRVLE
jgi:hypothetical protein